MLPSVQFSCFIYCISLPALLLILRGYLAATAGIGEIEYGQVNWRISVKTAQAWVIRGDKNRYVSPFGGSLGT